MQVVSGEGYSLHEGDCLDVLRTFPDNTFDTVITDPPAGISFMGKEWDGSKGGRARWIAWLAEVMVECLRVAKPGAMMLCWSIPRTSHWTGTAIEQAGWEVRDVITHLFGSGFPKSHDISKAIDRAAGVEPEVIGTIKKTHIGGPNGHEGWDRPSHWNDDGTPKRHMDITAPATDAAKEWAGF